MRPLACLLSALLFGWKLTDRVWGLGTYRVRSSRASPETAVCPHFQQSIFRTVVFRHTRLHVRSMCATDNSQSQINLTDSNTEDGVLSEDLKRVLAAQGITWRDVLDMRATIAEQGQKKNYEDKSMRAENTAVPAANTLGHQIPKPQHLGTTLRSSDFKVDNLSSDEEERRLLSKGEGLAGTKQVIHSKKSETARRRAGGFDESPAEQHAAVPCDGNRLPTRRARDKEPAPSTAAATAITEGVTLEAMLNYLVGAVGFPALYAALPLKCFHNRPTATSSLKVLRQAEMEWARRKLQTLYIEARERELS